jgi:hypothetical protein
MKKEEKFHALHIMDCPECGRPLVIVDIEFSTKGSVKFELACFLCESEKGEEEEPDIITAVISWNDIVHYCAEAEEENSTKAVVLGTGRRQ